jgi:hypothetical protein
VRADADQRGPGKQQETVDVITLADHRTLLAKRVKRRHHPPERLLPLASGAAAALGECPGNALFAKNGYFMSGTY